jgi:hypothetical protein
MPAGFGAAAGQQRRWEGGKIALATRYVPQLLASGVRSASLPRIGGALDLLVPPLSAHLLLAAALVVAGVALGGTYQVVSGAALLALVFYVLVGFVTSGLPLRVYGSLFYAPFYIGWKALLFARELRRRTDPPWLRTVRNR